jgi:hypothetical protein
VKQSLTAGAGKELEAVLRKRLQVGSISQITVIIRLFTTVTDPF